MPSTQFFSWALPTGRAASGSMRRFCGRFCMNRAMVTYKSFLRTGNMATATSRILTPRSYGRHGGAGVRRATSANSRCRPPLTKTQPGEADRAFRESLDDLCQALERSCSVFACQMRWLTASLLRARARFHAVPARFDSSRPLIGIVGEIFCRLNNVSNQDLVRRLEEQGAECWIADIAEWIGYTNMEEVRNLRLAGRSYSSEMIKSKLRSRA